MLNQKDGKSGKERSTVRLGRIFTVVLLASSISTAQSKIDRLENLLETVSGEEKIDVLNNLSDSYGYSNPSKSLHYAQEALKIIDETDDNIRKHRIFTNLSNAYFHLGSYEKSLEYSRKQLHISKLMKNKSLIADTLINIGSTYYTLDEY